MTFDFRWRHPRHAALVCLRAVFDVFTTFDVVWSVDIGELHVLVMTSRACISERALVRVSCSGFWSICAIFISANDVQRDCYKKGNRKKGIEKVAATRVKEENDSGGSCE